MTTGSTPASDQVFDVVIDGGLVADGSGGPPAVADVGVLGDRIAAVGDLRGAARARTIDARGLVVAPGFVDVHSHSDISLLADPRAESELLQGVTTQIVGNCGHGPAPIADTAPFRANVYGALPGLALDWVDLPSYLARLDAVRPAVNVMTLVPNGNLRLAVLGTDARPVTPAERRAMCMLLDQALEAGAVGLSTGLEYPLEAPTTADDLLALCEVVARHAGLHATHTRARGEGVVEATEEAVAVARATGVRTQVAHALPRVEAPAGTLDRLLALLERSAASLDVAWDMHTRTFAGAGLASVLPAEVLAEGMGREEILAASRRAVAAGTGLLASFARGGWARVFLAGDGPVRTFDGSSIEDLAAARGSDALEVLVDAWVAGSGDRDRLMVHAQTYDEDGIATMVRTGRGMPASDSASQSRGGPYPRVILHGAFSWAAWTLRRLVRERRDLELGDAVARLTSLPASRAGLRNRGRLVVGAAADVAVFDPAAVVDRATPEDPLLPAVGVRDVLVNGRQAVADGVLTGDRAGQVLRG